MTYDSSFFDIIRSGCIKSAEIVVPKVIERLGPIASVIDVGCGEGWWANEFGKFGAYTVGIDNDGYNSPNQADLDNWLQIDMVNFGLRFEYADRFHLAICLEVAEHLPEFRADDLVKFLCDASDNVLFSAAIPMQGGVGHINEQWPNYWIHKFNHLGYYATEFGTDFWGDPDVEPWYQQNMFLLKKHNRAVFMQHHFPIIHPAFWSTRTGAPPA